MADVVITPVVTLGVHIPQSKVIQEKEVIKQFWRCSKADKKLFTLSLDSNAGLRRLT